MKFIKQWRGFFLSGKSAYDRRSETTAVLPPHVCVWVNDACLCAGGGDGARIVPVGEGRAGEAGEWEWWLKVSVFGTVYASSECPRYFIVL